MEGVLTLVKDSPWPEWIMEWIEFVLVVSSTLIWNPVRRQYPPPRNPTACTLIG